MDAGRHAALDRLAQLAAKGYVVLRFTWEEIMASPEAVVRAVLQVLLP